jgi:hypothetical protein
MARPSVQIEMLCTQLDLHSAPQHVDLLTALLGRRDMCAFCRLEKWQAGQQL